ERAAGSCVTRRDKPGGSPRPILEIVPKLVAPEFLRWNGQVEDREVVAPVDPGLLDVQAGARRPHPELVEIVLERALAQDDFSLRKGKHFVRQMHLLRPEADQVHLDAAEDSVVRGTVAEG